jgi:formate dehydrogenase maturation protein FdhE
VRESWDRRIRRARQLASEHGAAESLLTFYARLLERQRDLYDSFSTQASGSFDRDVSIVCAAALSLLRDVGEHGPELLASDGRRMLESGGAAMEEALTAYWRTPADRHFYPKAILQPYGQCLADRGMATIDRGLTRTDNRCPRCGGAPQLSILEPAGAMEVDGGSRRLLCADCLTPWPFRRVRCPHCGEDDERRLGYFQTPAFEHVRVDACDSCRHYIKSVDLARSGLAVPLVDEVAAAALDLWAREHGYEKVELNLVGL